MLLCRTVDLFVFCLSTQKLTFEDKLDIFEFFCSFPLASYALVFIILTFLAAVKKRRSRWQRLFQFQFLQHSEHSRNVTWLFILMKSVIFRFSVIHSHKKKIESECKRFSICDLQENSLKLRCVNKAERQLCQNQNKHSQFLDSF